MRRLGEELKQKKGSVWGKNAPGTNILRIMSLKLLMLAFWQRHGIISCGRVDVYTETKVSTDEKREPELKCF